MKVNVFTLCEGHYHFGVAAMVNSLLETGFEGNVSIYFKGDLPPWTKQLKRQGDNVFQIGGVTLTFRPTLIGRHFGYHKPFAAVEEFQRDPACEAVVYADPDVVFLGPWSFFEEWMSCGVALCLDDSFPFVSQHHPWRKKWADLLARSTGDQPNATEHYANSGFFGVTRRDIDFLHKWIALTQAFEAEGGNTVSFEALRRHQAVVGDQDLMAAAEMGWSGKTSILGLEGMGFSGLNIFLSHDIGYPKPWIRPYLRQVLSGMPVSAAASYYFRYANAPIAPYSSIELLWKKAGFRFAQVVSRVWSRP